MTTNDSRPPRQPRWLSALLILSLAVLPFLLAGLGRAAGEAVAWPHGAWLALGGYLVALTLFVLRRADCWMWATFLSAMVAHTLLWRIADDAGAPLRFAYVLDVDRALGGGTLPTVWLQAHVPATGVADVLLFAVYATFYGVPFVALTALRTAGYERARRYVVATLLTLCASLIAFTLVPTAPPWMAAQRGLVEPIDRIVHELAFTATAPTSATYAAVANNEVAAMPSLHMAVTVLCAIALVGAYPRLRRSGWTYGVLMGFALVYLGEHYVVDVAAGALLAVGAYSLAGVLVRRFGPHAAREAARPLPAALGRPANS